MSGPAGRPAGPGVGGPGARRGPGMMGAMIPTGAKAQNFRASFRRLLERLRPEMPRIALDIDTPEDLALFVRTPSQTRAYALLRQWRLRLDDEGLPATSA